MRDDFRLAGQVERPRLPVRVCDEGGGELSHNFSFFQHLSTKMSIHQQDVPTSPRCPSSPTRKDALSPLPLLHQPLEEGRNSPPTLEDAPLPLPNYRASSLLTYLLISLPHRSSPLFTHSLTLPQQHPPPTHQRPPPSHIPSQRIHDPHTPTIAPPPLQHPPTSQHLIFLILNLFPRPVKTPTFPSHSPTPPLSR
jgi:hypothetical protein